MSPKTICLDFDDTLRMADGSVAADAREAVNALYDEGHRILILSARFNPRIWGELVEGRKRKVEDWLAENGVRFHEVVGFKPAADVYVDDKALRYEGDWNATVGEIRARLRI